MPSVYDDAVLEAHDVSVTFPGRAGHTHALRGASLALARGRTVALVGESGSGKSTLGRVLLGLQAPTAGHVRCNGVEVYRRRRPNPGVGRQVQAVFQNPSSSLDPRKTVGRQLSRSVELAGRVSRQGVDEAVEVLLEEVGLSPASNFTARYPHQLSGGQQQRVAIARAVAFQPDYLIADEPTSALDVSVRVQILTVLRRVQAEHRMGILFITHDLATVRAIADDVHVLYLGEVIESGPARSLFDHPEHPYTRALMGASPTLAPERSVTNYRLSGEPPSAVDVPTGCSLHPRCPVAVPVCAQDHPAPLHVEPGWHARCHLTGQLPVHPSAEARPSARPWGAGVAQ